MGGIGGILLHGEQKDTHLAYENMLETLIQRVPNRYNQRQNPRDYGRYISPQACLLGSPQPVRGVLGLRSYVLVCDGELYNKDELRRELGVLGYRFADTSCAAVLLHSYMAWGPACLDKLLGVYAFAVWDEEQIFIARDRLGMKPLFYSAGNFGLVFASHIKTLLCHPAVKPTLAPQGIADLLLLGPGRTPGSAFLKGIQELKPGCFISCRAGTAPQVQPYWQLKAKPHRENFTETAEIVRALVTDAAHRQAPPDSQTAVGTLLSGGLDSSILASVSGSKNTFSVDYIGSESHFTPNAFQPEDDRTYIQEMTAYLKSRHSRYAIGTDELADALIPAMEARGLPGMGDVDASLLLLCRHVCEAVPIALSGEGADEIFGGYPWYIDEEKRNADTFPWSQSLKHRLSFVKTGALGGIDPEEYVRARYKSSVAQAQTLYDDTPEDRRIRQLFLLNLQWFFQTLASRSEAMSAAAGLNLRTPYLDHRLVEYLYNVPWAFKYHENREKGLLREAFKGKLPERVLWRKKSPFPKTHNPAYLRKMQDMLNELLMDKNAPLFQIANREALQKLAQQKEPEKPAPWYGQLMTLPQTIAFFLQINAWMARYEVQV